MRIFLTGLALLIAACAVPPDDDEAATGPVLVTVLSDTGAGTAPTEGLFRIYGIEGPATGLTAADLAALPSDTIETDFPAGAAPRAFSGPRLSAVLEAVGAAGMGARLTASDGYQVELTAAEIAAGEPVLATHVNSAPLVTGGLGPSVLVWRRGSDPAYAEMTDDLWPWAVFAVQALEAPGGSG
ncbi:MAG: hypothetical protein ABL308_03280 [Oceanicaulis sp.]